MFRNIRLPGEDNGLFVFRFQLIPGKKKRKELNTIIRPQYKDEKKHYHTYNNTGV